MKKNLLFVDDRASRAYAMLKDLSEYNVAIAANVPEALRMLSRYKWDVVSLDHDLNGHDFQNPESPESGMEIVRYIIKTKYGFGDGQKLPKFIIHTTNQMAARMMESALNEAGYAVSRKPFGWKPYQVGVVAGAFDVIHPGYIDLLQYAKSICFRVVILLHDKPKQVFEIEDRKKVLFGLRYVDNVIVYRTEEELSEILRTLDFDVRIVGSDHRGSTSRPEVRTIYHERTGNWSATMYKDMIANSVYLDEEN